jgi:hypothetical protein
MGYTSQRVINGRTSINVRLRTESQSLERGCDQCGTWTPERKILTNAVSTNAFWKPSIFSLLLKQYKGNAGVNVVQTSSRQFWYGLEVLAL